MDESQAQSEKRPSEDALPDMPTWSGRLSGPAGTASTEGAPINKPSTGQFSRWGVWLWVFSIWMGWGPLLTFGGISQSIDFLKRPPSPLSEVGRNCIIGTTLVAALFLVMQVYTAYLFFRRRKSAPTAVVLLFITYYIVTGTIDIWEQSARRGWSQTQTTFAATVVVFAIWIPYFRLFFIRRRARPGAVVFLFVASLFVTLYIFEATGGNFGYAIGYLFGSGMWGISAHSSPYEIFAFQLNGLTAIVPAAVWIPYFRYSNAVKRNFVR